MKAAGILPYNNSEVTLMQSFYRRGSLAPESRRVVSGTKENYRTVGVSDLIDGVTIIGAALGEVFTPGSARLQINNSERLAIENSERFQLFGVRGVIRPGQPRRDHRRPVQSG